MKLPKGETIFIESGKSSITITNSGKDIGRCVVSQDDNVVANVTLDKKGQKQTVNIDKNYDTTVKNTGNSELDVK
jgi:hypothetical protein